MKWNIVFNRMPNPYLKEPLSVWEQINLLKDRWLSFSNENYAKKFLGNVSYYRLSAYTRVFFQRNDEGELIKDEEWKEIFIDGVTFKDITELYNFDEHLRILLLEALENLEVSFKTVIINTMSVKYKTWFWMIDSNNFASEKSKNLIMQTIDDEIFKNKEKSNPIKHYYSTYTSPEIPPCWMLMQILPFWTVCTLYKNLKKVDMAEIASAYNLKFYHVESWFFWLSYLRNLCAHSDWVRNRKMRISMTIKWIDKKYEVLVWDKLFCYLIIICYLYENIDEESYKIWKKKLINLIKSSSLVRGRLKDMWFPENWELLLSSKIVMFKNLSLLKKKKNNKT